MIVYHVFLSLVQWRRFTNVRQYKRDTYPLPRPDRRDLSTQWPAVAMLRMVRSEIGHISKAGMKEKTTTVSVVEIIYKNAGLIQAVHGCR
ncbi:hypothetical protein MAR_015371 [Mya arenaria]|uniref:Ribosomal protein S7 n=1 Tax=Mya arenaria TaxID=6604 RepID=A0ABY7FH05_MYAAR|nr:hypothetical protein MAR_015371 [Mya arenaria]